MARSRFYRTRTPRRLRRSVARSRTVRTYSRASGAARRGWVTRRRLYGPRGRRG